MRRFFKKLFFHPNPKTRLIITLVYCGIGIFLNFFGPQVFCMPVLYARVMCIAFFSVIVLFPFVKAGWLQIVMYFLLGTGVPICVYCILFLGDPYNLLSNYIYYVLAACIFGIGLLAFIPFYLLVHIYCYYWYAGVSGKRALKAGIVAPLLALAVYLIAFQHWLSVCEKIESDSHSKQEFVSKLPGGYFTERILGLHWKYHTSMELIYDGWRPPLHDPLLIIALWLHPHELYHAAYMRFFEFDNHPFYQPENNSLWPDYNNEAVKFYHRKFPDRPIIERCSCSFGGNGYFSAQFDTVGVKRH